MPNCEADCPSPSRIGVDNVEYQYAVLFGSSELRYSNFQSSQRTAAHVSYIFSRFRIVAKSAFCLRPVRPSVSLTHASACHTRWTVFCEILYWRVLLNWRENQILLKSDKYFWVDGRKILKYVLRM